MYRLNRPGAQKAERIHEKYTKFEETAEKSVKAVCRDIKTFFSAL